MTSQPTFAFITPSYAPDFQRCKLLCWSIKEFVRSPVKHYIVVDRKDKTLFQQLADADTIVLETESVVPNWLKHIRIPWYDRRNIWLNFHGYRSRNWIVRGWLVQQIVKLSAAQFAVEDILLFVDSDVAFVDTFDMNSLVQKVDGKSPLVSLFRVSHNQDNDYPGLKSWKQIGQQLLGLPATEKYFDFYIGNIITWRRDNLLKLYQHIERCNNGNWIEILLGQRDLSEYVLYGLFVSYVLGSESGHYDDHRHGVCKEYWNDCPMSQKQLEQFISDAKSGSYKSVMISAKSSMNLTIDEFQTLLANNDVSGLQPSPRLPATVT